MCVYICMHVYAYICVCTHVYTHTCVHVYFYIYAHMCVHIHVYVHIIHNRIRICERVVVKWGADTQTSGGAVHSNNLDRKSDVE